MYTAVFFIVLILVSGFVAYIGDYIGRSLGKKRLTMFGLRPKHTAIVSTVITGMIISVLALGVLTGINSQFRQVIFHGQAILKNNEKLTKESLDLSLANKALVAEQKRLEKETQSKNADYDRIKKNWQRAKKDYDSAKAAYMVSAGEVKTLKADIAKRRNELDSLKQKNILSQKQLKEKENRLKADEVRLKEMEQSLETSGKELEELAMTLAEQKKQKEEAQRELEAANNHLAEVRISLTEAEHNLDIAKEAMKEYANLRLSTVIIRQEDEIARGVVDGSRTVPEISSQLMLLLANANEICYNIVSKYKSVPVTESGEKAAAAFKNAYVRLVFVDEAGGIYEDNIKVMVMACAEAIKNKGGDTLITISSAGNLTDADIGSQPIPVEFRLYEYKLVYAKNELISSVRFSGSESEADIFTRLYDFYTNTVLSESTSKGTVAAQMSPLYRFYCRKALEDNPPLRLFSADKDASMTEQVKVILELMKEIKDKGKPVSVRLYAKKNLYSADVITVNNTTVEVAE